MIDIKYVYIFYIVIIFFLYGLILSEIIDYIFPEYNCDIEDYRILIEIIGEIGIAYIIYFAFKRYSEYFIKHIFKQICDKPPSYLNRLLLIAFSYGIFKHLQKSTNKIKHFHKKFITDNKIFS